MKLLFALLISISILPVVVHSQIMLQETEVDTSTIITGLDIPWEIIYGPDDHLWITERFGRVSRIHPETGEQFIILDISNTVYQSGESGLLGMVLHPDFDESPFVFLSYTYNIGGNILERIVRYEYEGGLLGNEFILLDNITGNTTHDGCRLIITPDYKLLITTGDAQNQPAAQNLNSLNGKILRLNLDGSIPNDNPWENNPVYSFGHRNAQGLFYAPNGVLYSSEHGPSTDDEFNIIEAGQNYGWPNVHGFCNLPNEITFCEANNVIEPLVAWTPTTATSDIIYYDHPSIPEWTNRILLTTLKNKRLYVLELDEDGTSVIGEDQYFTNVWGRLRDVCQGPDGSIFLATNGSDWGNSQPFTHSIVKVWNPDYIASSESQQNQLDIVQVYPNPVKDNLNISINSKHTGQNLKIISDKGQVVIEQVLDSTMTSISTIGLKNGIYLLMVGDASNPVYSDKIMIIRD